MDEATLVWLALAGALEAEPPMLPAGHVPEAARPGMSPRRLPWKPASPQSRSRHRACPRGGPAGSSNSFRQIHLSSNAAAQTLSQRRSGSNRMCGAWASEGSDLRRRRSMCSWRQRTSQWYKSGQTPVPPVGIGLDLVAVVDEGAERHRMEAEGPALKRR